MKLGGGGSHDVARGETSTAILWATTLTRQGTGHPTGTECCVVGSNLRCEAYTGSVRAV
jgi:hypothetical protein